ncbi:MULTISPECIES: hypothetical protein [Rhodomicrobium]|uniref:hypothetical protein n=1 Tax=Rhodomicrobium TaxID=1068 RepID=UPI000F74B608|nr:MULTISPECIES: hypothetical protein [Rhodomicrobium]
MIYQDNLIARGEPMPFKTMPPLYHVWVDMRQRCTNPKFRQWEDYGGRGIKVCERWGSYALFEADMSPRPPGMLLDRVDNDGDYNPDNCKWSTRKEQQRNQRITRKIMADGVSYIAADLAEKSGLKTDTILYRAAQGLSLAEIIAPERRVYTEGLALGGRASGAKQLARTHCREGHKFTPENTRITPQGWRVCRKCHAKKAARQRQHKI